MLIDKIGTFLAGLAVVLFGAAALVLVFSVGPWITVQAVNHLAGETVLTFGFWTWAAIVWLSCIIKILTGARGKQ